MFTSLPKNSRNKLRNNSRLNVKKISNRKQQISPNKVKLSTRNKTKENQNRIKTVSSSIRKPETKNYQSGNKQITELTDKIKLLDADIIKLADSYVVFARESGGERPRFGAFWLAGDAPGRRVEPSKVIAPHPIGAVILEDAFVPEAHRLGAPGDGLKIALANLEVFRVTVGAAALGLADRALEETVRHLRGRVQFGKPLAEQQGLQFALADVATDHVAAQLLVYRAASARDEGRGTPDQAAMAKMFATESAQRTIDRAVQSFGGPL